MDQLSQTVAPHISGLTAKQADRLFKVGKRNIQSTRSARPYSRIILESVFNLFNIALFVSIAVVLYLGGSRDVLFATGLLVFNISVSLFQELRARRALDKLSMLSQSTALVRRDLHELQIPMDAIVQGDVVVLKPGQAIVVDGPVLFGAGLEVNESSLTGESHDISKTQGQELTSGSYCTAGFALMEAKKIGPQSFLSKMTSQAKTYQRQYTPVENRINGVLRWMIAAIAIFAPLTLVSGINIQLPLATSVENMISLLTSLVPQGLIASVAILYTYGAVRISRSNTLIQKINAVESLGAVTILCTDKTGTLTQNKLQVQEIVSLAGQTRSELKKTLALIAAHTTNHNTTSAAIARFAPAASATPIKEVVFKSERKWSGVSINQHSGKSSLIIGAPEIVMTKSEYAIHKNHIQQYTSQGKRVVTLVSQAQLLNPDKPHLEDTRNPLGLVVLGDSLRPQIEQTLRDFAQVGVSVKVISGDNIDTVQAIAGQAGLVSSKSVQQSDLVNLSDKDFAIIIDQASIFARITPEMKQKIIKFLKQSGHIAMIGDGVNDVPALKQANVAVAMNSGAQMAKDVADVVLLDDSFATLPKAIHEGRDISQRIYAIAKVFFIKAIYLMILFILAGFASIPFPIELRQTTLLGFVITGIPILCITLKVIGVAKPKDPASDFLSYTVAGGVIGGLALAYISIVTSTVFQHSPELGKTMVTVFAAIYSSAILWLVAGIRLWDIILVRRIKDMAILTLLTIVAVGVPVVWAPDLFFLVPLHIGQLLFLGGLAILCVILLQYVKDKIDKLPPLIAARSSNPS